MGKNKSRSDLAKLISLLPNKITLSLIALSVLVTLVGLAVLLQPYLLKTFIDGLEQKEFSLSTLVIMGGLVLAAYLVEMLLISLYIKYHIRLEKFIRNEITTKAFTLNPNKIKGLGEGYVTKLFNDSIYYVMRLFTPEVTKTLIDMVKIVAVLIILGFVSPSSLLICCILIVLFLVNFVITIKLFNPKLDAFYEQYRVLNEQITEGLSNTELLKTYPRFRESFLRNFRATVEKVYKSLWGVELYFSTLYTLVTNCLLPLGRIVIYGIIGYQVFMVSASISVLVLVLTYIIIVETSLSSVSNFYQSVLYAKSASKKLFDFLNMDDKKVFEGGVEPDFFIRAEGYALSFESRTLIEPSSFRLELGKIYNLSGKNGQGKSSFIQHIMNTSNNYRGHLYFLNDSVSLEHYDIADHIAYLGQDFEILNDELEQNVLMGEEAPSDFDEVLNFLEIAHLKGRSLGSGGEFVSGGERRRINLARFMMRLRSREYFIADEAFISLDKEYLDKIRQHLAEALKGKTGIIVSHDDFWVDSICDQTISISANTFWVNNQDGLKS